MGNKFDIGDCFLCNLDNTIKREWLVSAIGYENYIEAEPGNIQKYIYIMAEPGDKKSDNRKTISISKLRTLEKSNNKYKLCKNTSFLYVIWEKV